MAQGRADARDELRDPEGLGDVIVGAVVQGFDLAAFAGAAGQDDDGHLRPAGTHAADNLQSVQIGKPQIQDRDIRLCTADKGKRLFGGLGFEHVETFR